MDEKYYSSFISDMNQALLTSVYKSKKPKQVSNVPVS